MTGNEQTSPNPHPPSGHKAELLQSTALASTPEAAAYGDTAQTPSGAADAAQGSPALIDEASSDSAPLGAASLDAAPAEPHSFDREAAREAALAAVLPHVPAEGWTLAALRAHAGPDADLLFPNGVPELIEAYIASADQHMVADAGPTLAAMRLPDRVKALILARLGRAEPHRVATRRALAILALPANTALAARTLAHTVDEIWHAAGDRSADFSWYTKRAILASVYTATLLFWLNERNTAADTEAFLDRRLAGVARIGKLRRRLAA